MEDGFILISGGTFEMGSPDEEAWRSDDEKLHTVMVSLFCPEGQSALCGLAFFKN